MASPAQQADTLEFIEAISLLIRRVRASIHTSPNDPALSLSEVTVLARLAREGPATTADLARAEGVRPQSMGTTLAALQQLGAVARTPHPTDGRQHLLTLTPAGAALRDRIRAAKRSWLADSIAELPAAEQQTLFAAAALIRKLAERRQPAQEAVL